MDEVYLDHHTTTPLDKEVKAVMLPFFEERFGNYLQPHAKGQELVKDLQEAYQSVYRLLNSDSDQDVLIMTSCSEEAIAQAFHIAFVNKMQQEGKNHFLTLATEDAPILMNLETLKSRGCKVEMLNLSEGGLLNEEEIIEHISPRTAMVSLSLAHGLTGIIQPIEKLKEICKMRGIYLHLDISYAIGKIDIDVKDFEADFLTFGGDKFHGPKSSGALYVQKGHDVSPLIAGGLSQRGFRGGPIDPSQVIGLAKAFELANQHTNEMCLEIASQRDLLERLVQESLDDVTVLFEDHLRLPNVTVLAFKNVASDALLYELNAQKVYATHGGVHFQKLSLLLESIGHSSKISNSSLSFALSRSTTLAEVQRAAQAIVQSVQKLRKLSEGLEAYAHS